jgi:hypothetical protein
MPANVYAPAAAPPPVPMPVAAPMMPGPVPGAGGVPMPPQLVPMARPAAIPGPAPAPPPIVPSGPAMYGAVPVPPLVSPGSLDGPKPPPPVLGMTSSAIAEPLPIPDAGEAPVLIGFLVTFQNEPTGKFWPLRSGRTTLGRSGSDNAAEVALADASTSARHAVVQGDPSTGQAFIEDAGSRNGTFVNEQKLMPGTQRQLHDNDRVRLGSITLVVKLLASA